MLKSAAVVGLLILPAAFFVLGLACIHPRLRKQLVALTGLSTPLTRAGHAYAAIRARLPSHSAHPAREPGM